jgi:hypothetical protein
MLKKRSHNHNNNQTKNTQTKISKPKAGCAVFNKINKLLFYQTENSLSRIFPPSQENFKGTNKSHQCDTT